MNKIDKLEKEIKKLKKSTFSVSLDRSAGGSITSISKSGNKIKAKTSKGEILSSSYTPSPYTDILSRFVIVDGDLRILGNMHTTGSNAAFMEGLSAVGGIAEESDPIFVASPAHGITAGNITSWSAGGTFATTHLSDYNHGNIANGQTAFGWGDWSTHFGSTAGTICVGNDSRLSDARTPVSHAHGNVTNAGLIGVTANLPVITGTGGILQAGAFGTTSTTFCVGNDSRLSDARTPVSHTHGNITNAGAIGSTATLPIITTTSGVLTVGSFGSTAGTFCVGNDARLSDARVASDVYAWAKASTKPSYNYSEIGGTVPIWNQNTTGSATYWNGNAFSDYLNQAVKTTSSPTFAGVLKSGSSDSYMLLGGGGHKAVGDFYLASNPNLYVTQGDLAGVFQPVDPDLTAIAAISATSGLLRKTAENTWSLDASLDTLLSLFERKGTGTTGDPYKIEAKYAFYSLFSNAAFGEGLSAGGGLVTESDPIWSAFATNNGVDVAHVGYWNAAYTHSKNTTTAVHGATTVGYNMFHLANPSAITFPRLNADNTVSSLSASDYRTAIGLGSAALKSDTYFALLAGSNSQAFSVSTLTAATSVTINGALYNCYKGANSEGLNLFIGGGGQSSIGEVGATSKGSYDTAVGMRAAYYNTTGYNFTAVGYAAAYSNTTGYNFTAVGMYAAYYNTTGSNFTAVGLRAGIGNQSTAQKSVTDNNMTLIGAFSSKNNEAELTNGIAIGYNAKVLLSNQVVLGNTDITSTILRGAVSGLTTLSASGQITSTLASGGLPPFAVTSTVVNTNLNADMVDGYHLNQNVLTTSTPKFTGVRLTNGTAAQDVIISIDTNGAVKFLNADGITVTNIYATGSNAAFGEGLSASGGLAVESDPIWSAFATANSVDVTHVGYWNTAYTDRNKWDGGSTGLVAATGRASLGLVIGTDVLAYRTFGSAANSATTDFLAYNGTAVNSSLLENHNAAYFEIAGAWSAHFGTTAGTICVGNDARLSDARTPVSHTHGNITNAGYIGTTANLPVITGTGGVLQAGAFGTTSTTFCVGNDSRLSDARTPVSHTHGNITNAGAIGSTATLPIITTTSGVLTVGSFGSTAGTFCVGNDARLSDARVSNIAPGASGNIMTSNGSVWTSAAPYSYSHPNYSIEDGIGGTLGHIKSSERTAWNAKQGSLTFGIADGNAVKIDEESVAANDYAKFTASGLIGRSYAEVLSDIGAEAALGNPSVSGYLLSSTTAGVRSWVAPYSHPDYSIEPGIGGTLGHIKASYKLSLDTLLSLFERKGTGTTGDPYKIEAKYAFYSLFSNAAFGEGLSATGGIAEELDPVFTAHAAYNVTSTKITHWDTAYGWGNHAGLYDTSGAATGAVSYHESTYNHANFLTTATLPVASSTTSGIVDINTQTFAGSKNFGNTVLITTDDDYGLEVDVLQSDCQYPIYIHDGTVEVFYIDRVGYKLYSVFDIYEGAYSLSEKYAAIADAFPGFGSTHATAAYGDHTHSAYAGLYGSSTVSFTANDFNCYGVLNIAYGSTANILLGNGSAYAISTLLSGYATQSWVSSNYTTFPGFGTSGTTAAYGNHGHASYAAIGGSASNDFAVAELTCTYIVINGISIAVTAAPANNATGVTGEMRLCADGIYKCVYTNTWQRIQFGNY